MTTSLNLLVHIWPALSPVTVMHYYLWDWTTQANLHSLRASMTSMSLGHPSPCRWFIVVLFLLSVAQPSQFVKRIPPPTNFNSEDQMFTCCVFNPTD